MNILLWHVHGSWTTSFVQGKHRYLVPVTPDRGPDGRGRARTYDWPDTVEELAPEQLASADVDVVILQRPHEAELAARWLRRRLPAIYVEHNTPKGAVPETRHPMADLDDLLLVHVTHFNALFWDAGTTRTAVVEHGIVPPAARYTGELARLAVVSNEPVRRWRVTGTDLLPRFAAVAPIDVYGMGVAALPDRLAPVPPSPPPLGHAGPAGSAERRARAGRPGWLTVHDDLPQQRMHAELAHRRAYLHLCRWTSLGLSLIEAMAIGMPVVVLATTEAAAAVPPDAGIVATRLDTLVDAAQWLLEEPAAAHRLGERARTAAYTRYGLDRFLSDWDRLLEEELCVSR